MTEMNRFVSHDWYGYSGAERFSDGSEPFIGYATPEEWPERCCEQLVIIADATGVTVNGEDGFFSLELPDNPFVSETLAKTIPETVGPKWLTEHGFTACNFPEPAGKYDCTLCYKNIPTSQEYEDSDGMMWHKKCYERKDNQCCAGCGNGPGDGYTEGCDDPNGCGFWKEMESYYGESKADKRTTD